MEKTGNLSPFDEGRRNFLRAALGITVVVAAAAATPFCIDLLRFRKLLNKFADSALSADASAERVHNLEALPPGFLIPEDERGGSHLLMGEIPGYSFSDGYNLREFCNEKGDFLSKLPEGTEVRIMALELYTDDFLEIVRSTFPHLKFAIYPMPQSHGGFNYPQDVVFSSGRTDSQGRFIIVGSSLDPQLYKGILAFNPGFSDIDKADEGNSYFGDEYLAERFPLNFDIKHVPVPCIGGDMQIVRLPNGKIGAIVGVESLARFLSICDGNFYRRISFEKYKSLVGEFKEICKRFLGIGEVVILDEDFMASVVAEKGRALRSEMQPHYFFHSDMAVKVMTGKDGRAVAFVSDMEDISYGRNGNMEFLRRIQEQLQRLGYVVEKVPCSSRATFNYVNSVVLSRNGRKMVYVPQYGGYFDREALDSYKRHGFDPVPVSLREKVESIASDNGNMENFGGLHCSVVVLM